MEDQNFVQIRFFTKQSQYAIPNNPYAIPAESTITELNEIINTVLRTKSDQVTSNEKPQEFDFLISGEFLRTKLRSHLLARDISFEDTIQIEYVERFPAPEPQDVLLHDDWVSAVQANGLWVLTGCYDNSITIWTVSGQQVLTITEHTAPVKSVCWISLNENWGYFVSTSKDQTAMIWQWDINKNVVECMALCKGHERGIDCVDANSKTKLMGTGSWDTLLKIWSTEIGEPYAQGSGGDETLSKKIKNEPNNTRVPKMTLKGHREAISGIQWMTDDTIVTSSWDHTLKIWDLTMEGIKSEFTGNKPFFDISYSKLNGLMLTASADKNLKLYEPRSNHAAIVKCTYYGHTEWIQSVCWSKTEENLFVSGSYDHKVKLWDVRSSKAPLYDLIAHENHVHAVDWSHPKYIFSGGSDNTVRVFKHGGGGNNNNNNEAEKEKVIIDELEL